LLAEGNLNAEPIKVSFEYLEFDSADSNARNKEQNIANVYKNETGRNLQTYDILGW
jgi:hypothetical protein